MIVSHKHRYVFVELPHTASTAISKELTESYAGEPILKKHACYHEFEKQATADEKTYFVFSGIRNPMDEVVSIYLKYKTNHGDAYTDPAKLKKNGGYVTDSDIKKYKYVSASSGGFPAFLKKFYKVPYDNWSSLAHHRFDYIVSFENLQEDFKKVLELIGLDQVRPLPMANRTGDKRDFLSYYTPDIQPYARYIFAPFMERWNYRFPAEWEDQSAPIFATLAYNTLIPLRNFYWKSLRQSSALPAKLFRMAVGR